MIIIETNRTGYSPRQVGWTMTVGELIKELELFDEEEKVYFSNDNGYTYGHIREEDIYETEEEED